MEGFIVEIGADVKAYTYCGRQIRFKTQHESHIFGALALAHPLELSREKIAQILWPNSSQRLQGQNLRQRLSNLKKSIDGHIDADRSAITLIVPSLKVVRKDEFEAGDRTSLTVCSKIVEAAAHQTDGLQNANSESIRARLIDIIETNSVPQLTSDQLDQYQRKVTDESNQYESRLMLACIESASYLRPGIGTHVLHYPSLFTNETKNQSRFAQMSLSFLYQKCSAVAHNNGYWMHSINLESESLRLCKSSRSFSDISNSYFRLIRKNIDQKMSIQAHEHLYKLSKSKKISSRLQMLTKMNLVHSHAWHNELSQAEELSRLCRTDPDFANSSDLYSWLCLNEAFMFSQIGNALRAVESLREAHHSVQYRIEPLTNLWHWYAAVPVFNQLEKYDIAARLWGMADRARTEIQACVTPTNQSHLTKAVAITSKNLTPQKWLQESTLAFNIPIAQYNQLYQETLYSV